MKIKQISIFLENKEGRLSEVCSLLGENQINIRALSLAESEAFGVLRMVVDKPDEAVVLLKSKGLVAKLTDIVAVEVNDQPGGLANILKKLTENAVNVEYMYGFLEQRASVALLVFRFDDTDKAINILRSNGITVVGKNDIYSL